MPKENLKNLLRYTSSDMKNDCIKMQMSACCMECGLHATASDMATTTQLKCKTWCWCKAKHGMRMNEMSSSSNWIGVRCREKQSGNLKEKKIEAKLITLHYIQVSRRLYCYHHSGSLIVFQSICLSLRSLLGWLVGWSICHLASYRQMLRRLIVHCFASSWLPWTLSENLQVRRTAYFLCIPCE